MAIGIWTPVLGSAVQMVFPDRLNILAARVQTTALAAGAHMRFTNLGCHPVFVHSANPNSDATGFTGTPVGPGHDVVLPRVSPVWVYSPYENLSLSIDVGTLT